MSELFTPQSKTVAVVAVLYTERLSPDWLSLLEASKLGFFTSPYHAPGDDKKEHIHVYIKNMHGHPLSYKKVMSLLSRCNPDPLTPCCAGSSSEDMSKIAAYFLHLTPDSKDKEQFDRSEVKEHD